MQPVAPPPSARPWGPVGTCLIGCGLIWLAGAAFGVGIACLVVLALATHPGADLKPLLDDPRADLIATGLTVLALAFGSWLAVLVKDVPAQDYLALRRPALRPALLYLAVTALWIAAVLVLGPAFGHFPGLFLAERPAGITVGLLAAAALRVLGVPLAIELFARGFLWYGLAGGRLSPLPALAASTLAGTFLHGILFASGPIYWFLAGIENLVLGLARWRTGSLPLCAGLHALIVIGLFGGGLFGG
jgi:membrane protease YdiL (CAAX protease family)